MRRTTKEPSFDPWQWQQVFLLSKKSHPVVGAHLATFSIETGDYFSGEGVQLPEPAEHSSVEG